MSLASRLAAGALLGVAALQSAPCAAQSFASNRFTPTPPGDSFESVAGAGVSGEELFRAGLTLDYARAPLVARSSPSPIIANEIVLHASLSLTLWERLLFSGSLPIVLLQEGSRATFPGSPPLVLAAPGSPGLGDFNLGARVRISSRDASALRLAGGAELWLPTGRPADLTGDTSARGMPYVAMSGVLSRFAYATRVGVLIQKSVDLVDVHLGTELSLGAAAAFVSRSSQWQAGPEVRVALPFTTGSSPANARVSLELLGAVRFRLSNVVLGLAAGPGVLRGAGSPDVRVLSTLAFAPVGESDADKDGVIDRQDACVTQAGTPNEDVELNGCPSDRDADGILDLADACPDEPGVVSYDRLRNGCPLQTDRDGDDIPDKVDACPDDSGPSNKDAKKNGCPPDRDGDGILDAEDACPDVRGADDVDPKKRGCPADQDGDGIADAEDACPKRPGKKTQEPSTNGCPASALGEIFIAAPRLRGPMPPPRDP